MKKNFLNSNEDHKGYILRIWKVNKDSFFSFKVQPIRTDKFYPYPV
jgi:hypothetical protein